MEVVIKTEGLSKTFKGNRGKEVNALKGLNLEISKGEIFGFLGPNGAGKSTTIKLLMGLISPTSGGFFVKGAASSSKEYKKYIGYLPENPAFYDYLNAEELLYFVGNSFSMRRIDIEKKSENILKTLDIYEERLRPIRSYSKGMVQRLGLAQALIHDPEIYVLDEPMSGLDPLGRILVRDIILELKAKGKAVFMSTHILNDIETICDRVGIIINGDLKRVVNTKEILESDISYYDITISSMSNIPQSLNFFKIHDGGSVIRGGQSPQTPGIPPKALRCSNSKNTFNLKVSPQDLNKVLIIISENKDITLHLIQPERSGLEHLFTKIVLGA